ncbi:hypothetical protein ACROYT_G032532 [Oculina patagonica]
MVMYCMALGCNNKSKKRKDLTFYRLPRDQELLKRWLVNLRKPTLPQCLDYLAVCSEHFEPECFGRDLKAELLGGRPKPPLLKGSVPTLFLYNNFKANVKRRVVSEERRKRKEKEEILKDLLGPYYNMKPDKQNLTSESPMEDGELEDKFSIQSLLPGFARAYEDETNTCHDQARSGTEVDVSTDHDQIRLGAEVDVSTGYDQIRLGSEVDVSTDHDQIRLGTEVDISTADDQIRPGTEVDVSIGDDQTRSGIVVDVSIGHDHNRSGTDFDVSSSHDQARTCAEKTSTSPKQCNKRKKKEEISCQTITPSYFASVARVFRFNPNSKILILDQACQTDEKPTAEISCQAKPCLVSVETQWDEKDFTPDPEQVKQDHSYCKRKRPSK